MKQKIKLASSSPRRREILEREGIEYEVIKPNVEESMIEGLAIEEQVMNLAKQKAQSISTSGIILAADTLVYYDDVILGKPNSKEDAYMMLSLLRNREHYVITGVCIINDGAIKTLYEKTKIVFNNYSDQDIIDYIETGEPMDKAGAYAIQGIGAKLVKSYEGDFDNVVGLPIDKIKHLL